MIVLILIGVKCVTQKMLYLGGRPCQVCVLYVLSVKCCEYIIFVYVCALLLDMSI